jgi:hypothetical protein
MEESLRFARQDGAQFTVEEEEQGGWRKRLAELVGLDAIDRILGDAEAAGISVDGPDGLLGQIRSPRWCRSAR